VIGLDTNVLVRYITRDDRVQAARADRLMDSLSADSPAFVNRIVLCELVWVLGRGYRYERPAIAGVIETILSSEALVVEDHELAMEALARYRDEDLDFADALIGAINLAAGCSTTARFDDAAAGLAGFELLSVLPA
jgi:predicted nucleic-acid-binding protein